MFLLRKYSPAFKITASSLIITLTWTSIAWSAPHLPSVLQTNPKFDQPTDFSIPAELGHVDEVFSPDSKVQTPAVVYIQDAHANLDAQSNIQKMIRLISEQLNIHTILAEGASGAADLSLIRAFPDQKIKELATQFWLKETILSGIEKEALLSPDSYFLLGAENKNLYDTNRVEFLKVLEHQKEFLPKIETLIAENKTLKEKTYHLELFQFEEKIERYSKEEKLSELVSILWNTGRDLGIKRIDLTHLEKFISLILLELSLRDNEKQAEFLKLSRAIGAKELFSEMDALKDRIREKLFQNDKEKKLHFESEMLKSVQSMVLLQATPNDFNFYLKNKNEIQKFLRKSGILTALDLAEQFYVTSKKREDAFLEKTKKAIFEHRKIFFVTGGFHTSDMTDRFRKENISFIVISPKVSPETNFDHYYERMRGTKLDFQEFESKFKEFIRSSAITAPLQTFQPEFQSEAIRFLQMVPKKNRNAFSRSELRTEEFLPAKEQVPYGPFLAAGFRLIKQIGEGRFAKAFTFDVPDVNKLNMTDVIGWATVTGLQGFFLMFPSTIPMILRIAPRGHIEDPLEIFRQSKELSVHPSVASLIWAGVVGGFTFHMSERVGPEHGIRLDHLLLPQNEETYQNLFAGNAARLIRTGLQLLWAIFKFEDEGLPHGDLIGNIMLDDTGNIKILRDRLEGHPDLIPASGDLPERSMKNVFGMPLSEYRKLSFKEKIALDRKQAAVALIQLFGRADLVNIKASYDRYPPVRLALDRNDRTQLGRIFRERERDRLRVFITNLYFNRFASREEILAAYADVFKGKWAVSKTLPADRMNLVGYAKKISDKNQPFKLNNDDFARIWETNLTTELRQSGDQHTAALTIGGRTFEQVFQSLDMERQPVFEIVNNQRIALSEKDPILELALRFAFPFVFMHANPDLQRNLLDGVLVVKASEKALGKKTETKLSIAYGEEGSGLIAVRYGTEVGYVERNALAKMAATLNKSIMLTDYIYIVLSKLLTPEVHDQIAKELEKQGITIAELSTLLADARNDNPELRKKILIFVNDLIENRTGESHFPLVPNPFSTPSRSELRVKEGNGGVTRRGFLRAAVSAASMVPHIGNIGKVLDLFSSTQMSVSLKRIMNNAIGHFVSDYFPWLGSSSDYEEYGDFAGEMSMAMQVRALEDPAIQAALKRVEPDFLTAHSDVAKQLASADALLKKHAALEKTDPGAFFKMLKADDQTGFARQLSNLRFQGLSDDLAVSFRMAGMLAGKAVGTTSLQAGDWKILNDRLGYWGERFARTFSIAKALPKERFDKIKTKVTPNSNFTADKIEEEIIAQAEESLPELSKEIDALQFQVKYDGTEDILFGGEGFKRLTPEKRERYQKLIALERQYRLLQESAQQLKQPRSELRVPYFVFYRSTPSPSEFERYLKVFMATDDLPKMRAAIYNLVKLAKAAEQFLEIIKEKEPLGKTGDEFRSKLEKMVDTALESNTLEEIIEARRKDFYHFGGDNIMKLHEYFRKFNLRTAWNERAEHLQIYLQAIRQDAARVIFEENSRTWKSLWLGPEDFHKDLIFDSRKEMQWILFAASPLVSFALVFLYAGTWLIDYTANSNITGFLTLSWCGAFAVFIVLFKRIFSTMEMKDPEQLNRLADEKLHELSTEYLPEMSEDSTQNLSAAHPLRSELRAPYYLKVLKRSDDSANTARSELRSLSIKKFTRRQWRKISRNKFRTFLVLSLVGIGAWTGYSGYRFYTDPMAQAKYEIQKAKNTDLETNHNIGFVDLTAKPATTQSAANSKLDPSKGFIFGNPVLRQAIDDALNALKWHDRPAYEEISQLSVVKDNKIPELPFAFSVKGRGLTETGPGVIGETKLHGTLDYLKEDGEAVQKAILKSHYKNYIDSRFNMSLFLFGFPLTLFLTVGAVALREFFRLWNRNERRARESGISRAEYEAAKRHALGKTGRSGNPGGEKRSELRSMDVTEGGLKERGKERMRQREPQWNAAKLPTGVIHIGYLRNVVKNISNFPTDEKETLNDWIRQQYQLAKENQESADSEERLELLRKMAKAQSIILEAEATEEPAKELTEPLPAALGSDVKAETQDKNLLTPQERGELFWNGVLKFAKAIGLESLHSAGEVSEAQSPVGEGLKELIVEQAELYQASSGHSQYIFVMPIMLTRFLDPNLEALINQFVADQFDKLNNSVEQTLKGYRQTEKENIKDQVNREINMFGLSTNTYIAYRFSTNQTGFVELKPIGFVDKPLFHPGFFEAREGFPIDLASKSVLNPMIRLNAKFDPRSGEAIDIQNQLYTLSGRVRTLGLIQTNEEEREETPGTSEPTQDDLETLIRTYENLDRLEKQSPELAYAIATLIKSEKLIDDDAVWKRISRLRFEVGDKEDPFGDQTKVTAWLHMPLWKRILGKIFGLNREGIPLQIMAIMTGLGLAFLITGTWMSLLGASFVKYGLFGAAVKLILDLRKPTKFNFFIPWMKKKFGWDEIQKRTATLEHIAKLLTGKDPLDPQMKAVVDRIESSSKESRSELRQHLERNPAISQAEPPAPKVAVFGLNGTLVDTTEIQSKTFGKLYHWILGKTPDEPAEEHLEAGIRFFRSTIGQFSSQQIQTMVQRSNAPPEELHKIANTIAERYKIFTQEFRSYSVSSKFLKIYEAVLLDLTKTTEITLLPGVEQFLHYLHQNHIPIYVVTGTVDSFAKKLLQKAGVASYFRGIYGAKIKGDNKIKLTKEYYLWRIAAQRNLQDHEVILFGDEIRDMESTKTQNRRIFAVGITTDPVQKGALFKAGANFVGYSFADWWYWLPALNLPLPQETKIKIFIGDTFSFAHEGHAGSDFALGLDFKVFKTANDESAILIKPVYDAIGSSGLVIIRTEWYRKQNSKMLAKNFEELRGEESHTISMNEEENSFFIARKFRDKIEVLGRVALDQILKGAEEVVLNVSRVPGTHVFPTDFSQTSLSYEKSLRYLIGDWIGTRVVQNVIKEFGNKKETHEIIQKISSRLIESLKSESHLSDFAKEITSYFESHPKVVNAVLNYFKESILKLLRSNINQESRYFTIVINRNFIAYLMMLRKQLKIAEETHKSQSREAAEKVASQITNLIDLIWNTYFESYILSANSILDSHGFEGVDGLLEAVFDLEQASLYLDRMKHFRAHYTFQFPESELAKAWSRVNSHADHEVVPQNDDEKRILKRISIYSRREHAWRLNEATKEVGNYAYQIKLDDVGFVIAGRGQARSYLKKLFAMINKRMRGELAGFQEIPTAVLFSVLAIGNRGAHFRKRLDETIPKGRKHAFSVFANEIRNAGRTDHEGREEEEVGIDGTHFQRKGSPSPGSNLYDAYIFGKELRRLESDFEKHAPGKGNNKNAWDYNRKLGEVIKIYNRMVRLAMPRGMEIYRPFSKTDPRVLLLLIHLSDAIYKEQRGLHRAIEHLIITDVFGKGYEEFKKRYAGKAIQRNQKEMMEEYINWLFVHDKWLANLGGVPRRIMRELFYETGFIQNRFSDVFQIIDPQIQAGKEETPVVVFYGSGSPTKHTSEALNGLRVNPVYRGKAAFYRRSSQAQPVNEGIKAFDESHRLLELLKGGEDIYSDLPKETEQFLAELILEFGNDVRKKITELQTLHYQIASVSERKAVEVIRQEQEKILQARIEQALTTSEGRRFEKTELTELVRNLMRQLLEGVASKGSHDGSRELEGFPPAISEKIIQAIHDRYSNRSGYRPVPLFLGIHILRTYQSIETKKPFVQAVVTRKARLLLEPILKSIEVPGIGSVSIEYKDWREETKKWAGIDRLAREREMDEEIPIFFLKIPFEYKEEKLKPIQEDDFFKAIQGAFYLSLLESMQGHGETISSKIDSHHIYDHLLQYEMTDDETNYVKKISASILDAALSIVNAKSELRAESKGSIAPKAFVTGRSELRARRGMFEWLSGKKEIELKGDPNSVFGVFRGTTMWFASVNYKKAAYYLENRWDNEKILSLKVNWVKNEFQKLVEDALSNIQEPKNTRLIRFIQLSARSVISEIQAKKYNMYGAKTLFGNMVNEKLQNLREQSKIEEAKQLESYVLPILSPKELNDEEIEVEIKRLKSFMRSLEASYMYKINDFKSKGHGQESMALATILTQLTGLWGETRISASAETQLIDLIRKERTSAAEILIKYLNPEFAKNMSSSEQTKLPSLVQYFLMFQESIAKEKGLIDTLDQTMDTGDMNQIRSEIDNIKKAAANSQEMLMCFYNLILYLNYGERFDVALEKEDTEHKTEEEAGHFKSVFDSLQSSHIQNDPVLSTGNVLNVLRNETENIIRQQRMYAESALHHAVESFLQDLNERIESIKKDKIETSRGFHEAKHLEQFKTALLNFIYELSERIRRPYAVQESMLKAENLIVVTETMSIMDLDALRATYPNLKVIVTKKGSSREHWAIVAAGDQIATITSVIEDLNLVESDAEAYADATKGKLYVHPTRATKEKMEKRIVEERALERLASQFAKQPNLFKTSQRNSQVVIGGSVENSSQFDVLSRMTRSIELFRTELSIPPGIEHYDFDRNLEWYEGQFKDLVVDLGRHFPDGVVVRTLDRQADKDAGMESNAYGFKFYKTKEGEKFLRLQIRASFQAAAILAKERETLSHISSARLPGKIKILIPQVSAVEELDWVRSIMEEEKQKLIDRSEITNDIHVLFGIMIETQEALKNLDTLSNPSKVDFISIGTNDLTSAIFGGIKRETGNKAFEKLLPRFLKAIESIVKFAAERGIEIGVCGEWASRRRFELFAEKLSRKYKVSIRLGAKVGTIPRVKLMQAFVQDKNLTFFDRTDLGYEEFDKLALEQVEILEEKIKQTSEFHHVFDVMKGEREKELAELATARSELRLSGAEFKQKFGPIVILHKPRGVTSALKREPQTPDVPVAIELLPEAYRNFHLMGRLDKNSTGLILFAKDSRLQAFFENPNNQIPKTYIVDARGRVSEEELAVLRQGVAIRKIVKGKNKGRQTVSAISARIFSFDPNNNTTKVEITIQEGLNWQVRRMFTAIHHPVIRLKRVGFGYFRLRDLPQREFRELTDVEYNWLARIYTEQLKNKSTRAELRASPLNQLTDWIAQQIGLDREAVLYIVSDIAVISGASELPRLINSPGFDQQETQSDSLKALAMLYRSGYFAINGIERLTNFSEQAKQIATAAGKNIDDVFGLIYRLAEGFYFTGSNADQKMALLSGQVENVKAEFVDNNEAVTVFLIMSALGKQMFFSKEIGFLLLEGITTQISEAKKIFPKKGLEILFLLESLAWNGYFNHEAPLKNQFEKFIRKLGDIRDLFGTDSDEVFELLYKFSGNGDFFQGDPKGKFDKLIEDLSALKELLGDAFRLTLRLGIGKLELEEYFEGEHGARRFSDLVSQIKELTAQQPEMSEQELVEEVDEKILQPMLDEWQKARGLIEDDSDPLDDERRSELRREIKAKGNILISFSELTADELFRRSLIQSLRRDPDSKIKMVILAPEYELASQVEKKIEMENLFEGLDIFGTQNGSGTRIQIWAREQFRENLRIGRELKPEEAYSLLLEHFREHIPVAIGNRSILYQLTNRTGRFQNLLIPTSLDAVQLAETLLILKSLDDSIDFKQWMDDSGIMITEKLANNLMQLMLARAELRQAA